MTGCQCCQQPFAVREGLQASKEGEQGGGGERREGEETEQQQRRGITGNRWLNRSSLPFPGHG